MKKITIPFSIICLLIFDLSAQNTGNFYSGSSNDNNGTFGNFYSGSNTSYYSNQSEIDYSKFQQLIDARSSQRQSQFKIAHSYLEYCYSLKESTKKFADKDIDASIDRIITDLKQAKEIIAQNYEIESFIPFEKRINEIVISYNLKIESYKKKLEVYSNGLSNYENGNYNLAIYYFKEVYFDDKFKNSSAFYLALCYFKLKDFNNGEKYLTELKGKTSQLHSLYYAGGWCLYENNKFQEAIDYFNICLSTAPKNEYIYYSRGSALSGLKKYEDAISDYKIAIEINPNFSMAYNNLSWAYYEMGNYKLALVYANISIEKDPNNHIAWDSRADIKLKLYDYKGAIIDASKSLELNPSMPNSLLILAKSNYKLGYKTKSCEFLARASAMNFKEADVLMKEYKCGF